jgi:hypothetical protein
MVETTAAISNLRFKPRCIKFKDYSAQLDVPQAWPHPSQPQSHAQDPSPSAPLDAQLPLQPQPQLAQPSPQPLDSQLVLGVSAWATLAEKIVPTSFFKTFRPENMLKTTMKNPRTTNKIDHAVDVQFLVKFTIAMITDHHNNLADAKPNLLVDSRHSLNRHCQPDTMHRC